MMTIWKSLIQPKMDYCSQLWSPSNQAAITKLENVQRHFTSKITGMEGKDYWDRIKDLGLYSQERRRERYQMIFIWKISQGLVRGYNTHFENDGRRGRMARPKTVSLRSKATVRNAREASFGVKGAKLFNLLPKDIRGVTSEKVESFKTVLDEFLRRVPDEPTVPGRARAAETNSLLHQIPLMTRGQVN